MTLKELMDLGIFDKFMAVFPDRASIEILLVAIDFPDHGLSGLPNNGSTRDLWAYVCKQIKHGILPSTDTINEDNMQPLVDVAARYYPSNYTFTTYCSTAIKNRIEAQKNKVTNLYLDENPVTIYVLVQGCSQHDCLKNIAREFALAKGIPPENISLGLANTKGALLHLKNWTEEQVLALVDAVRNAVWSDGQVPHSTIAKAEYLEFIVKQFFSDGPME